MKEQSHRDVTAISFALRGSFLYFDSVCSSRVCISSPHYHFERISMKIRSLFVVAACLLFAAGCDKATDPSSDKPVLAAVSISIPAANFSDTCNAPAYLYASLAQSLVQYASMYTSLPSGTNVNGVWTWTFTEGTMTATMTARKLGDGRYEWKLVLNGTDGSTTYTNWTAIVATSSADGKSGTLTAYDDTPTPSTTADILMTWSTAANNVATIEIESVSDAMKSVLISNGVTGDVRLYRKVGSAWVAAGHYVWTAPAALATCA
jgi:hypothetical protein